MEQSIGDRIKAARIQAGMTQRELANKLGISYVNISQIENGYRDPRYETLLKIFVALDTSIFGEQSEEKSEMAEIGWDNIVSRIVNRTVEPPQGETVQSLSAWLDGYAKCQLDILNIIEEMSKGQN